MLDTISTYIQTYIANTWVHIQWDVLLLNIWVIYLLVIWFGLLVWAIRDTSARGGGVFMQILAVVLILCLTPILGLPIYLLVRPRYSMYDISPDMDMPKCPSCDTTVETNYLYCPSCHTQIQQVCDICGGYCDPTWTICAYCGEPRGKDVTTK
jgi:hypothetical protein